LFGTTNVAGRTTARNVAAFEELALRQRLMVDITERDLGVEVFGARIDMPVMLSPTSGHKLFHPDGELATVRAAGAMGTLFCPGMVMDFSLEQVAAAASGPLWCQLYMLKNREIIEILVRRAEAAGYQAIVFTVDTPTLRVPTFRPAFEPAPPEVTFANFATIELPGVPNRSNWLQHRAAPFVWSDLAWIRSLTKVPVILKGIQTGEDARLCVEHGVDGVVVSNHGGYALADAEASLRRLPEVVAAVGRQIDVYFDGGIRRGTDVLKALALGARAVLIGRPMAWGLAADGQAGVERVLTILRQEIEAGMASCGITSVREVDRSYVRYAVGSDWFAER
jgi:4-hydroxymandelate oxidase